MIDEIMNNPESYDIDVIMLELLKVVKVLEQRIETLEEKMI